MYAAKNDVKKAIAFRNRLAHSLYVEDAKTKQPELLSNLLDPRRGKVKVESLNAATIERHREALRIAMDRIIQAGGDRLWDPLKVDEVEADE